MKEPDRTRTCNHGYPTITMQHEESGEGWLVDVVQDCPRCPKMMNVGIPYKPGTPPPSPGDRKRSVQEIAADVERRARSESKVSPLPETCLECGGILGPNSKTVPAAGGGRRHVTGSPACRAPSHPTSRHVEAPPAPAEAPAAVERPVAPKKSAETPEDHNCPTCGRPVVEGAPYDLPALRKALVEALKAVDELTAGADREQAALEELDGGSP